MNSEYFVSIIISTYNRASIIGETINSVIEQSYFNWECIIVDDGSTDNTEEVVANFEAKDSRIKYFSRPNNLPKGPNSARNYGICKSKGNYIISLDSDDWILPNHLEKKISIFKQNPSIDAVLSKTIMVNDHKEEILREERTKLSNNLLEDFITLKISWYMHDIMWNKTFFEGKKLYNENLLKWLDRDFHIRRLSELPNIFLVDDYLALYRIHENSNSSNSNYKVLETRHKAVEDIIEILKEKKKLTPVIKLFFFKFQVQNLVVLYKSPKVFSLYFNLITKTFTFNFKYIKWIFKLVFGYISFKITGRGLKIIQ